MLDHKSRLISNKNFFFPWDNLGKSRASQNFPPFPVGPRIETGHLDFSLQLPAAHSNIRGGQIINLTIASHIRTIGKLGNPVLFCEAAPAIAFFVLMDPPAPPQNTCKVVAVAGRDVWGFGKTYFFLTSVRLASMGKSQMKVLKYAILFILLSLSRCWKRSSALLPDVTSRPWGQKFHVLLRFTSPLIIQRSVWKYPEKGVVIGAKLGARFPEQFSMDRSLPAANIFLKNVCSPNDSVCLHFLKIQFSC